MTHANLFLRYFSPREFGPNSHGRTMDWWPRMNPSLLVRVDVFRHLWRQPVEVSGHPNALGRHSGDSTSDHNVDRHGSVNGMDLFPRGLRTRADGLRALECAKRAGLSSFGIYPHWSSPGIHLGVRRPAHPFATWGAIRRNGVQTYVSLEEALRHLPE